MTSYLVILYINYLKLHTSALIIDFVQRSSSYANTINSLCGGTNTGNCETAYSAVDASCIDLLDNNNLSCTSTCGTQLSAAVAACGSSVSNHILTSHYCIFCYSFHMYVCG